MRKVLHIARLEVLAYLRQERVLLTLVALPLFQIGVVLYFPQAVEERQADREASATHDIVVERDASDEVVTWLRGRELEVRRVGNPERVVADGDADAGIALDGDVDGALAGRSEAEAEIFVRVSSRSSVAAGTAAGRALDELAATVTQRVAGAAGLGAAEAVGAVIDTRDVGDTPAGRQGSFALVAPLVLALALSGVTNVAATSLSSAKDARVLEPLLLLPYERWRIAAGKLAAAFGIGTVQAAVVAAALSIGAAVTATGPGAVPIAAESIPQLLVATTILLAVGAALGVLLGAIARGSAVVTAIAPVSGLLFVIVAFVMRAQGPAWGGALYPVPGIGALVLAREAVLERLSWLEVTVASVLSIAAVVASVALAGRFLRSDRGVLRATR
jgi:sodium transport system permease protein